MVTKNIQEEVKVQNEPEIKTLKFHNVVAGGIKRSIEKSVKNKNDIKQKDILEELDITSINENGQKVHSFFGELAIDGFRPSYIWSDDRVNDIKSRISIYTALALSTNKDEASFIVMTGLPLLHLESLKEEYERTLPGTMEITFNSGIWEGKTKKITIVEAKVTAQGYGVYLNQILDIQGKVVRKDLTKGQIGILDTGFRTTNFLYIRDAEPKDLGSTQTEDGINVVHERIQQFINQNGGFVPIEEIERVYKDNKYEISNGTIIDFELEKTIALNDLSNSIQQNANRLWTIENMKSIIIAGGGGSAIYDKIKYKQKEIGENSQFDNSIGYLKGIIRQLNKNQEYLKQGIIPAGIDSGYGYMKAAILE
jgi:hypothetical protein